MSQEMSNNAFFKGNVISAKYNESSDKTYAYNPYIEALPILISNEKAAGLLRRMPYYDNEERSKSALERIHFAQRASNCLVPLPDHLLMVEKFQRMIRNGYMARNPLSAEWVRQIRNGFPDIDWAGAYEGYIPTIRKTGMGFNCYGASGVGKSTAVESVLSLLPQVIEHTSYNGRPFDQKQLVWLKLECPADGSLKALCRSFFVVSDAVLGTSKAERINPGLSAENLVPLMAKRADTLGLGVLVVDEIQRLSKAASGGAEKMLKFFVEMTNNIGVPVVLVGTYHAFSLFNQEFASARRGAGQGEMVMSNMLRDEVWDYFLESIWKYQFTNVETALTPKLNQALHEESQGIADICVKLYMLAQYQVIGTQDERITPELVSDVARANLHSARPMLEALRRGDIATLSRIPDLYLPQNILDRHRAGAEHRIMLSGALDTIKNNSHDLLQSNEGYVEPPEDKIAKLLVQAGYDQVVAVKSARVAVARFAQESSIKLATAEAFRIASEEEVDDGNPVDTEKPATKKQRAKVISLSGDLREIIKKAPKTMEPYQALKEAGIIKAADEFLKVC